MNHTVQSRDPREINFYFAKGIIFFSQGRKCAKLKFRIWAPEKKLFPIHKSGMVLPENAKIKFRNMAREKKLFPASWAGNNLQEKCEIKISHCAKKNYSRLAETVLACLQCEKKLFPAAGRRPAGGRPEAGWQPAGGRPAAEGHPGGESVLTVA